MNPSTYQVCLTYILRWPFWLVAAVYLIVCGIAIQFACFPNWYGRASNVFPDIPTPGPMEYVTEGLEQVDHGTRSLFWNPVRQEEMKAAASRPFPKLASLQIVAELKSVDELQFLRSMPNLEAFSLLGDLPPEGVNRIGELTRLRYLRLAEVPRDQGLKPLAGLSQLQILDLMRIPNYAQVLAELRQFPNLHTLVLHGPAGELFHASDWERLRSLPGLTHIYLRSGVGIPDRNRTDLDRVQKILPYVKVRPATVDERRSNIWYYVVLAGVLVWGMMTIQLQSQFAHAGSCLVPHYATSHLHVAKVLWAVTTLLHTVILYLGGCSFSASLAGSMAVPGVYWGWNAAMLRSSHKLLSNEFATQFVNRWNAAMSRSAHIQNQVRTLNPIFTIAMCIYTFPVIVMLSHYFLSDLDWFLEGRQPILARVVVLASLAALVLALLRIPRLHAIYQECIAGVPSLGTNPNARTIWGTNLAEIRPNSWKSWLSVDQGAQLDAVLAIPGPRNRSQLWIASNGINVPQIGIRVLIIMAIYLAFFRLVGWLGLMNFDWQPQQFLPFAAMMGGMWLEGGFVGLILIWRGRRHMLGHELLRPASRQQFVQELFAAIGRDLRPLLISQLVVAAILIWMAGAAGFPRLYLPALACYALFRGLSNYAAILFFLAIRRVWLMWTGLAIIWFLAFGLDGYFGWSSVRAGDWYPELAISLCLAGSVVALLILVWLKGYWQRIELA